MDEYRVLDNQNDSIKTVHLEIRKYVERCGVSITRFVTVINGGNCGSQRRRRHSLGWVAKTFLLTFHSRRSYCHFCCQLTDSARLPESLAVVFWPIICAINILLSLSLEFGLRLQWCVLQLVKLLARPLQVRGAPFSSAVRGLSISLACLPCLRLTQFAPMMKTTNRSNNLLSLIRLVRLVL